MPTPTSQLTWSDDPAYSEAPLWPPVKDGSAEQAEGYRALVSWVLWVDERCIRQGQPSPIQQAAERRRQREAVAA